MSDVFLVGFDPEARARVRAALPARHGIVELETAEAAFDHVALTVPDAVILDFPVPFRDGRSLTAVLRQDPRTSTVPIVAVSRWNWRRTRETASRLGCTTFITLDAPESDLGRALQRVLRTPALRPRTLTGATADLAGANVA